MTTCRRGAVASGSFITLAAESRGSQVLPGGQLARMIRPVRCLGYPTFGGRCRPATMGRRGKAVMTRGRANR